MKILLKVTVVIVLLVITFLSITAAEGGGVKVTIEGKGQPWVTKTGGDVNGGCDPVNNNTCTITIEVPNQ